MIMYDIVYFSAYSNKLIQQDELLEKIQYENKYKTLDKYGYKIYAKSFNPKNYIIRNSNESIGSTDIIKYIKQYKALPDYLKKENTNIAIAILTHSLVPLEEKLKFINYIPNTSNFQYEYLKNFGDDLANPRIMEHFFTEQEIKNIKFIDMIIQKSSTIHIPKNDIDRITNLNTLRS